MKTARQGCRRISPALALPLLAACGVSSTAPEPEPEPVAPTYEYAVEVETRYIDIRGSCDTDIFGDEVPGEFQYRLVVSGPGGERTPQVSSGYNTALGTMYQRNTGTSINFTNRKHVWVNLPSTSGIRVAFSMAEWDGVTKDSRMANRGATVAVEYSLGTTTQSVTLGANRPCQVKLFYDVTWSRNEVGTGT